MSGDKVKIVAISDHFSLFFFFSTALKVTAGNTASVCTMGTPDLKGNESKLSDWLLHSGKCGMECVKGRITDM